MTVERNQKNRAIGNHFIQDLFVREATRLEGWIRPTHTLDPCLCGMRFGVFFYTLLNLGDSPGAIQVYPSETQRSIHEMDVTISEARQHELALTIDHLRGFSPVGFNLRLVTDGEYFS